MHVLMSVLAGLFYSHGNSWMFYCFNEGFSWLPLTYGVIYGLLTGDLTNGIIIGASISTLYISLIAAGGNTPADSCAAGAIAVPIALMNNMDVGSAVALAVTIAILGNFLQPIQYNINGIFAHRADRYAEAGDVRGIRMQAVWCIVCNYLLRFPVAFCTVYFGTTAVDFVMNVLPDWVLNGLSVAGGILPALGIAMTMRVINKEKYFPLFVIGYFLVVLSGMSVLMAAILGGTLTAMIMVFQPAGNKEADADED